MYLFYLLLNFFWHHVKKTPIKKTSESRNYVPVSKLISWPSVFFLHEITLGDGFTILLYFCNFLCYGCFQNENEYL